MALDVEVLRNALSVGGVMLSPGRQRTGTVHVFTIPVDALRAYQFADVVHQPLARFRVALIK